MASAFKGATPERKQELQQRGTQIKAEIPAKKAEVEKLKLEIKAAEMILPNIPHPEVPLPSHLTGEELEWKQLVLRRVHRLMSEYEGLDEVDSV